MPVEHVTIDEHAGQRLDNFLITRLKLPKSRIYRLIRKGEVRVNKGRAAPSYKLSDGDVVRIPPVRPRLVDDGAADPELAFRASRVAERLERAILHEDEDLLVIDKPAGLAVHGGSGVAVGLIEALRDARNDRALELVHRIDRDTSGCLAIAKKRAALLHLQRQFADGAVRKRYDVVVWGTWPKRVRTIRAHLKRYVLANGERRVRVDASGAVARTDFELVKAGAWASRLMAFPRTGRTHQIRVHAMANGHPICGDTKYGDNGTRPANGQGGAASAGSASPGAVARLMLHARELVLPTARGVIRVEATPPATFEAEWAKLDARDR